VDGGMFCPAVLSEIVADVWRRGGVHCLRASLRKVQRSTTSLSQLQCGELLATTEQSLKLVQFEAGTAAISVCTPGLSDIDAASKSVACPPEPTVASPVATTAPAELRRDAVTSWPGGTPKAASCHGAEARRSRCGAATTGCGGGSGSSTAAPHHASTAQQNSTTCNLCMLFLRHTGKRICCKMGGIGFDHTVWGGL
jgi:hypothetical protein